VLEWVRNKRKSQQSWKVTIKDVEAGDFSLDFRNPDRLERESASFPALVTRGIGSVKGASESLARLSSKVEKLEKLSQSTWKRCALDSFLRRIRVEAEVNAEQRYKQITVKLYGKGVIERGELLGKEIKTRPQFVSHAGDLIMSRIDARHGAFGIIPSYLDGALVTQDFPMFRIDPERIEPEYLALVLKSEEFTEICKRASRGTTNRKRLNEALLLQETIPLPPKSVQMDILEFARDVGAASKDAQSLLDTLSEVERTVCNLAVTLPASADASCG
jgi:type I restriction enzyme M protein